MASKIIGPLRPPGTRHIVRLKDGTTRIAYMTICRQDVPDGTWLSDGVDITAYITEVLEPYMTPRKK